MVSRDFADGWSCEVTKVVVVMNVLMAIVGLLTIWRFLWSSGHVVLIVIAGLWRSWSFGGHEGR